MTVNLLYNPASYKSDGITTVFNFNFAFENENEIKIMYYDKDFNFVNYNEKFEVQGNYRNNGGQIKLDTPFEKGIEFAILRSTTQLQTSEYKNTNLNTTQIEKDFDKTCLMLQEIQQDCTNSLRYLINTLSLIDQDKALNEKKLNKISSGINQVALSLSFNSDSGKWELGTSELDPDRAMDKVLKASVDEAIDSVDDVKYLTSYTNEKHFESKNATNEEINNGLDIFKYINPKQINDIKNYLINKIDKKINITDAINKWNSELTFNAGDLTFLVDNNLPYLYYSKTDNNIGNNPLTDDTNWANLYNYMSSLISNNFVALDGSNAGFGNLSAEAKNNIVNLFQVDYSAGISMSSKNYTPPANGIIIGYFASSGANGFGVGVGPTVSAQRIVGLSSGITGQFVSTCIIVNKGELYSFDLTNVTATFYPFKNQLQEE